MPLVRIDLQKGKDAAYRQKAGQVVYEAMVAHTGVPRNDHFQIIGEHAIENFIFDPDYLGIHRTNDLIMVQIFFNEGRSVAQKQALYKAIAEGLCASLHVRLEDVFITCRGEEGKLVVRQRHRPVRGLIFLPDIPTGAHVNASRR
jgi:4-oxalocrotonate tautomerase